MAPEQILGRPIDARTDIYALSILLYELATGRRPFEAATPHEVEDLQLEAAPRPPSDLAPVPPAVEAVILRCLRKEPADRYPDVAALRDALQSSR